MVYLLGRPLTAEIHQIIYTHVSNLKDLDLLRCLTVSILAIDAGLLANIFYGFGMGALESLGLSVAIFILPGAEDAVIMLALQNPLAVLMALWAYLSSEALVSCCLILASMLLYPQWSFFLFVPLLVKYLIYQHRYLNVVYNELLKSTFIFAITAIFYYCFVKAFISLNNARAGSYAFTIDLNFFYWKLLSVFSKILPMSFNFWNIHTIPWLGLALMGLTIIVLRKQAILCFLIVLSTASFWLLARADVIIHRIFFVTSALALMAFLIGIKNSLPVSKNIGKYIMMGAMTVGLIDVHYLTFLNAVNYNIEFAYIKQSLLAYHKPFSRIHIVLPASNTKGYNGQETVDDTFNARTASYNFTTDTLNLVKAALKDNNVPTSWWVYSCEDDQRKCLRQMPLGYRILVTHTNKDQPVYYSPGMVLIDLNKL